MTALPELTGVDYIIAAAEALNDAHPGEYPFVKHFQTFAEQLAFGDEIARPIDELAPHEQTAILVTHTMLQTFIDESVTEGIADVFATWYSWLSRFECYIQLTRAPAFEGDVGLEKMPWE